MLVLILSLLLSLFGGSRDRDARVESICQEQGIGVQDRSSGAARDLALNRDLCLAAPTSTSFSGGGQNGPVSVRTSNSAHRTHSSTKSTSRMLKAGKMLCVRHFKSFLCAAPLAESGRQTADRYLFSICRLRL